MPIAEWEFAPQRVRLLTSLAITVYLMLVSLQAIVYGGGLGRPFDDVHLASSRHNYPNVLSLAHHLCFASCFKRIWFKVFLKFRDQQCDFTCGFFIT